MSIAGVGTMPCALAPPELPPPLREVFCVLSKDRQTCASDELGPRLFADESVARIVADTHGCLVEKWSVAAPELEAAEAHRSKIIELPERPSGLILPG